MSTTADQQISRASRAYILFALSVVNFMYSVDKVVISIFQEQIKKDYLLSDTQLGLLTGLAYALMGGIAGVPLARLADRWNRRYIIGASFMLWTVMTAACGVVGSWWQLFAARMGVGFGEAGSGPATFSMLGDYYAREERPHAIAITSVGQYLGVFGGMVAGGIFLQTLGWRAGFVILGVVGIVLAMIFHFTVREPARVHVGPGATPSLSEWRTMFGEPVAFLLLVGAFTTSLTAGAAVGSWLPSYFARAFPELKPVEIGAGIGICLGFATTIGAVVGGLIGNRYIGTSKSWAAGFAAVVAIIVTPFLLWTFHAPTAMLAFTSLFLAFLVVGTLVGPVLAMVQDLVKPGARATAAAVLALVGALMGQGLGPVLVGVISDWMHVKSGAGAEGLRLALTSVASIYVLTGFLFFALNRRIRHNEGIGTKQAGAAAAA